MFQKKQQINPDRMLTIRLPNWLGDVLMTLPALEALQQCGFDLQLLGRPWIHKLLANNFESLFSYPRQFSEAYHLLRQIPVSKMLLFTNSFSSAFTARCAAKEVVGYRTDGRRFLLTAGLKKIPGGHEVEYFWRLAQFAAQYFGLATAWPEQCHNRIQLNLNNQLQQTAQQILRHLQISSPYWILCPLAKGYGINNQSRIWPHWSALSKSLQQQGRNLLSCPGEEEVALCRTLLPEVPLALGVDLDVYAALLSGAEQVISNDSGPMHLAAAVGAPVLGIFGMTDPNRTRPWGGRYIGSYGRWPSLEEVLSAIDT